MLFKDIAGQEVIKKKLINNIKKRRVPHAQLFIGPEGSGKLAIALAFSQYINCENPSEEDACGECASCKKFNKLIHPDLHMFYPVANNKEFTKDTNSTTYISHWRELVLQNPYFSLMDWYSHIGIENKQGIIKADDCNEIIHLMNLKSYESPYKIVIIWMVEKLFHSAAPKLLKILEEPPEKTVFILIAENQQQILKTILSRTQVLKIPAVKESDIVEHLQNKYNADNMLAKKAAFLSAGNMATALYVVKHGYEHLDVFESFRDWMRACYSFKVEDIFKIVDSFAKVGREKQKSLLLYSVKMFRICLLINMKVENDSVLRIEGEEKAFLEKFSSFIVPSNTDDITRLFQEAYLNIERNANPKILFADLSFKMTRIMRSVK